VTPTARSLEVLRKLGYEADVVERWVPGARIRRDFLGCIDIVGVHPEHGIIGVQATTTGNIAARLAKAATEKRLRPWLEHARFEVWGWALRGPRGKRKLWTLRREKL